MASATDVTGGPPGGESFPTTGDVNRQASTAGLCYDLGMLTFLAGLALIIVPHSWRPWPAGRFIALVILGAALLIEILWALSGGTRPRWLLPPEATDAPRRCRMTDGSICFPIEEMRILLRFHRGILRLRIDLEAVWSCAPGPARRPRSSSLPRRGRHRSGPGASIKGRFGDPQFFGQQTHSLAGHGPLTDGPSELSRIHRLSMDHLLVAHDQTHISLARLKGIKPLSPESPGPNTTCLRLPLPSFAVSQDPAPAGPHKKLCCDARRGPAR